jgi:hypothetical protein
LSDTAVTNPFGAEQGTDTPVVDTENGWTAEEAAAVGDTEELNEVDTPEALDDEPEDTVDASATPVSEGAKPAAAPKAPARPAPPTGLITPVQFAKTLTEHLEAKGFSNKNGPVTSKSDTSPGNPIPPQYIYSMINQGSKPNAKNPIPTYVSAHDGTVYKTGEQPEGTPLARVNLMKADEGLDWWDAKDARVAASKTAKAEKAAKAAEKAAAAPAGTVDHPANGAATEPSTDEPVVEAE